MDDCMEMTNGVSAVWRGEDSKQQPNFHFEHEAARRGFSSVVGLDEAGRGSLAGPVVAAACLVEVEACGAIQGIDDSKRLSATDREELYRLLREHPGVKIGVGTVPHTRIDEINILQATLEAMGYAVANLFPLKPDFLLVDGAQIPAIGVAGIAVKKGDQRCISIAAASVIAKVERDRLMIRLSQEFPEFNFSSNKGYGTAAHRKLLTTSHSPIHRRSFEPLKSLINARKVGGSNTISDG